MIRTDLGIATAYAEAVSKGYPGTRDEFGQMFADFGKTAEKVTEDKKAVEQMKLSVEETKNSVDTTAAEFGQNVVDMTAEATAAITEHANTEKESATVAISEAKDAATGAITEAQTSATDAIASAKDSATAEITKKGTDTLATIPTDYTELTKDVSSLKEDTAALKKRQNVLVGSETGNPIAVDDAFSAPLCGLTVYGKSTQDGTPTPDNPVPIQSAGDSGAVDVTVAVANIFDAATAIAYRNIQRTSISDMCTISEKSQIVLTKTDYLAWLSQNFAPGTYTITFLANKKFYSIQTNSVESVSVIKDYEAQIVPGEVVSVTITESVPFFISIRPGAFEPPLEISDFMVCPGKTAPNAFVPYVTPQQLPIPTPNGLPGIPVTSGGNYTDQNGQQWVCDEVDLEKGVKVQRVDKTAFDSTKTLAEQNAILATPIETPLTPAEIAAYKDLTAYAPDTVVQASDGAGVKLEYQKDVNIAIKKLEDAIASMTAT